MHSATQIIAQRAPPAIRTKPRWQPYHSTNSLALRSPTVAYHHTPASSIVPPNQDFHPVEISAKEQSCSMSIPLTPSSQTPKDAPQRDATKHKFAAGLIDQAVNILTEIWRPQDVPDVFKAPSKGSAMNSALGHPHSLTTHQSMPAITNPPPPTPIAALMATQHASFTAANSKSPESNLLPMKTFVHEVLKRSRTSGSILQAALCYLEAIRSKVPEILEQEKKGIRAHYQPETKILPATEAELAREAELAEIENAFGIDVMESEQVDELKTVRATDGEDDEFESMQHIQMDSASISSLVVEPPSPVKATTATRPGSLPSPLLCPRRAFLASLILASKFFQDKCYSNRAWAKLSGLPPREIGRCERALGQALEWRLWVGKSAIQASPSSNSRSIMRSQSDANLFSGSTPSGRSLRRCLTAPAEVFNTTSNTSTACSATAVEDEFLEPMKSDITFRASSNAISDGIPLQPQYAEKFSSTPSPDTPGLTYSPSSTDSAGESTIQMSAFEEGMFPGLSGSQPWMDITSAVPTDVVATVLGNKKISGSASFTSGFGLAYARPQTKRIDIVDSEISALASHYASSYLWHADNRCISLETTDVH